MMSFEKEKVKIGHEITRLRKSKGWSIQELADNANMERSALSKLEKGKSANPTLRTLCRIADALEVPIKELV
jgi:transcriptional regulator with XRE-family HTH domain